MSSAVLESRGNDSDEWRAERVTVVEHNVELQNGCYALVLLLNKIFLQVLRYRISHDIELQGPVVEVGVRRLDLDMLAKLTRGHQHLVVPLDSLGSRFVAFS